MKATLGTIALVSLVLVAGCSSGSHTAGSAAVTVTVPGPTQTVTQTVTTTVTPAAPTVSGPAPMHKAMLYKDPTATVSVVVLDAKTDVKAAHSYDSPGQGQQFDAIEVKTCLVASTHQAVSISYLPWSLHFPSGAVSEDPATVSDTPDVEPAYPDGAATTVGECIRGWIVWRGPAGESPDLAVYAPGEISGTYHAPLDFKLNG